MLLIPFLAVYSLFLIYPFFRGIWISLHDWNLLAVAFNPDAKEFIGTRNYERVMWGRNITWGISPAPVLQGLGLVGVGLSVFFGRTGRLTGTTAWALGIASLLLFVLPGFHPGEGGRWFDRRFWPTVGNTLVFVGLTVPAVTITALVLAASLNRQTRAMAVMRTLFFLSQVLSVTVVTLIWQIMFSPRQGLIANVTTLFGGSPIVWLTDDRFAMAAIVITTVWWSLGIAMILFLAGLQDISRDLYEAGALDNATGLKAFWFITLPNLKRTITLVIVLQIILHFQVFGQAHLMTNGGPNDNHPGSLSDISTRPPSATVNWAGPRSWPCFSLSSWAAFRSFSSPWGGRRTDAEPVLLLARNRPGHPGVHLAGANDLDGFTELPAQRRAGPDDINDRAWPCADTLHNGQLCGPVCLWSDTDVVPELSDRRAWHDVGGLGRLHHRRLRPGPVGVSVQRTADRPLSDRFDGAGTGSLHPALYNVRRFRGGTTATTP